MYTYVIRKIKVPTKSLRKSEKGILSYNIISWVQFVGDGSVPLIIILFNPKLNAHRILLANMFKTCTYTQIELQSAILRKLLFNYFCLILNK